MIFETCYQDTLRSPPAENAVMKKVNMYSIGGSALFYFLVSFTGYAAYGDQVPGDILSAFSDVVWLIDIANICVILHLIGAYQVQSNPFSRIFASNYPLTHILIRCMRSLFSLYTKNGSKQHSQHHFSTKSEQ